MIYTTARFWEVHAIDSIYYGEILAGGKAGLGSAAGLVRGFASSIVPWAGPGWAGRLGWVALVRGFVGRSRVRVGELHAFALSLAHPRNK